MLLWVATLLVLVGCEAAALDMKGCLVVHIIKCNSGSASLPVPAESCGKDNYCRLLDENHITRETVYHNDKSVTVSCSSPAYFLKVDGQKSYVACYEFTETTPAQDLRSVPNKSTRPASSSPNKLLHLLLIVLLGLGLFV